MPTPAPANDAATTQRIVNDLNANFIVEAGAGTGKTYALVSRAVALVKAGHPMPGIVAITFTEAAAAELSERIRSRLEQLLDDHHPDNANDLLAANLTPDHRAHIRKAIAELDQASVQTIHSFAAQLLRERPLSAGLPPGWATLDEVETKERFDEEWESWLDWALGKDTGVGEDLQGNLRCLLEADANIANWQKIVNAFSSKYDRLSTSNVIPSIDITSVAQETLEGLQMLARECTNQSDTTFVQLSGAMATVQAVLDSASDNAAIQKALSDGAPVDFSGSTGSSNRNWNRTATQIRGEFRAIGRSFQQAVKVAPLLPLLHNLRQHFAIDYPNRRKAEGVATFDDLLVWARDLLRNDADARQHFQNKYSHILIDEFQDTDPLQAEIAFYLAAAPDANIPNQPWHALPLTPGKLFIVGDPKQSIYRFRNADLAVVQQVKDGGQLAPLTISENRRSQTPVLDWVNAVFGGADDAPGLMPADPGIQADYIPLQPNAGIQQAGLGTVQVFGDPLDDNADAVRRQQAKHVANLIAAYAGDSAGATRLNIYDKGSKCIRPANLGDVCILIRSRNGLGTLTRALEEANIPYRLEGASLFFNTQEVQDLLNCLRAIDDPADEVSVVAALRSPAFACSDADLLRWRDAFPQNPLWNYRSPLLDDDGDDDAKDSRQQQTRLPAASPVWDGMRQLRKYHQQSRTDSVAQLIAEFIRHRRLDELDLAENRPREIWRRRQFLVEQARSQEYAAATSPGAPPLTLRRFLNWTESRQQENARITEVAVPETDDDAVRIMTMHAAKGLEFPIAILLGLAQNPRNRDSEVLFNSSDSSVEIKAGDVATPGHADAVAREQKNTAAEEVRLAYVGATRARDHLLVSMYHSTNSRAQQNNGIIAKIAALSQNMELPHRPALVGIDDARPPLSSESAAINTGAYDLDGWQQSRADAIKQRSVPSAITATRLAHSGESDQDTPPPDGLQRGRGGRSGTAFGSALHSVLQNIVHEMQAAEQLPLPPDTPVANLLSQYDDRIKELAQSDAKSQGLTRRDGEIANLAQLALQNDSVVKALRAPRLWPEIPVAAPIDTPDGPVVIEGIIDLLYEDNNGDLVILDYKSDDIKADELDDRMKRHYQWQGAAYAAAIERATGKTVKDVQFLFVRLDEKDQPARSVDNLRALVAQVPKRVAGPP